MLALGGPLELLQPTAASPSGTWKLASHNLSPEGLAYPCQVPCAHLATLWETENFKNPQSRCLARKATHLNGRIAT